MSQLSDVGVFGMGVMGHNLAMNLAEKGYKVSVSNRSASPLRLTSAVDRATGDGVKLHPHMEPSNFIKSMAKPRKVIILVPAGDAVDNVIDELSPHLEQGDLIVDGGNEWFELSISRANKLILSGIHYMGMGISGGEDGARHGPCLMPGGSQQAYSLIEPILEKCCARSPADEACLAYIGGIGSGNYVKMVHNGIEYALMQLIAETYGILRGSTTMTNPDIGKVGRIEDK
jgi:6-phosphogluconate dehydrogenase